jgi:hypothetical protein
MARLLRALLDKVGARKPKGEPVRHLVLDGYPVDIRSVYLDRSSGPSEWRIHGSLTGRDALELGGTRTVEASVDDGSTFEGRGVAVVADAGYSGDPWDFFLTTIVLIEITGPIK